MRYYLQFLRNNQKWDLNFNIFRMETRHFLIIKLELNLIKIVQSSLFNTLLAFDVFIIIYIIAK